MGNNCHELTNLLFSVGKSTGRWPTFSGRQFLAEARSIKPQGVIAAGTQRTYPRRVITREARNGWHMARQMVDTRTILTAQQITAIMTHCTVVFIWVNTRHCLLRAAQTGVFYTQLKSQNHTVLVTYLQSDNSCQCIIPHQTRCALNHYHTGFVLNFTNVRDGATTKANNKGIKQTKC